MTANPPATPAASAIGPVNSPGPAQSAMLIHFCGRPPGTLPNPGLAPDVASMHPQERLTNILWEMHIRAGVPFGATRPAVSFSEASPSHLAWLVIQRGFPAWGLIYSKQEIFAKGGGPVWYARPEQAAEALGTPAQEWIVRYDTSEGSRSDWTHEQEWRLHTPAVQVLSGGLLGVLVDDVNWQPLKLFSTPVGSDGTPTTDPGEAVSEQLDWWVPSLTWPLQRFFIERNSGQVRPLPALSPRR